MEKKKSLKDFLKVYAICLAITNTPQFVITYTTPQNQLKPTFVEHLNSEMNSLRDISGGAVYTNFRLLGSATGSVAKRLTRCIEDLF